MDISSYFGGMCEATYAYETGVNFRAEAREYCAVGSEAYVAQGVAEQAIEADRRAKAGGEQSRNYTAKLWQAELERVADVRVPAEPADKLSNAVQGMLGAGMSAAQLREAIARAAVAHRGDFARTA